ncbi:hypothetical protein M441DRAFT_54662 [Trichoderma asperellum CBS 433.97]|uniref:Uncharacterized protein n=1 Tax=Trichoderma asperellum (strain ATCC 204424 / CBS 433.97 / NBRC 101777) TaxID=1042311 RepID=A0A2T3ZLE3_TRIA4|nr:hypothetical protein M441DRAFT_54662 [Trichoderma asperellum CBS 433.97]PTB45616.1 hypothetical protein M441DRAFT_54662 [Trichoderma asperellum CBS 433.97]
MMDGENEIEEREQKPFIAIFFIFQRSTPLNDVDNNNNTAQKGQGTSKNRELKQKNQRSTCDQAIPSQLK